MGMKRKLQVDATPAEQFACLREIPGLSAADCRQVISRLRDDDRGKATCHAPEVKFSHCAQDAANAHIAGT